MKPITFLGIFLFSFFAWGQYENEMSDSIKWRNSYPKFNAKSLIIPGVTLGYGFIALNNEGLQKINRNIKESLVGNRETEVDNWLIYVPGISVFAIDLFTHKARHDFKDRTFILFTAAAINNGMTFAIKKWTNEERPNHDGFNSFPSGHTSNAFMGAEFLRQEFKGRSPWYAIGGYAMAFTTAYFRLYNNKHWFSDVVGGAGLGILSTNIAYWIYPWFKYKVFKSKDIQAMAIPMYDGKNASLGFMVQF